MKSANLVLWAVLLLAMPSLAEEGAPLAAPPGNAPVVVSNAPDLTLTLPTPTLAPRQETYHRRWIEALVGAGTGLVAPVSAFFAATSERSFNGFFTGVGTATLVGWLLAPAAVMVTGHLLKAPGGLGRALLGTLVGLGVGLLVGGVLATSPNAAYLVGLGLLWTAPTAGALIGLEWGDPEPAPTDAAPI